MSLSVISFVILLFLIFMRVPVFMALLGAVFYLFYNDASISLTILPQRIIGGLRSVPLLAVPFFVTAGIIMNYTGITKRMMRFSEILTGRMPGGLAQVNVVLSTLMGGLSGSSLADAAMQSKVLVPEMEKRGYSCAFSSAVTGASALITPIIPPGIALVIYGYIGNVSIGRLFLAGIVPGIITCLAMMMLVHLISVKRGYLPISEKHPRPAEFFQALWQAMPALLMPLVIIGGIRLGVFTPTEAGAIAIVYALILGIFVYREMEWKHLKRVFVESTVSTASIMLIIGCAAAFAWSLTWLRVPQNVTNFIVLNLPSKVIFLIVINIFLLIVGMFIEGNAIMLVLIPILMPIIHSYGIDPVHFGLVFIFNMAVGSLSPPMGTVMFTVCSVTGCSIRDYIKESFPFYILLLTFLLLLTFVPQLSLFLPNLVFG